MKKNKRIYKGIKLTDSQWDVVTKMNQSDSFFNILCCSRQWGKSMLMSQLILRDAINNKGSKLLYAAPIYAQARKMYNDIFNGIAASGIVKEKNKSELFITLINGSIIKFVGCENYDSLRGLSINYMYIDEFVFVKYGAWSNALRPMLQVAGRKCYIASTPRQQGSEFHTLFNKGMAQEDRYFAIHKNYLDNPLANIAEVEDARKNLPDLIFKAEYLGEFIPNGAEVFAGLDRASIITAFRMPKPGEKVFAGLDLAKQHDYSVLTIVNDKGEVLFIYRDQKKDWNDMVHNINTYLKQYGVKKCLVESNSIGDTVIDMLIKGGAKNIIEPFATTPGSKPELIERLIVAFEQGTIRIPIKDVFPALYTELSSFTYTYNPKTRQVKYGAPNGSYDDCVMSLAFAIECLTKNNKRSSPSFHAIGINKEQ